MGENSLPNYGSVVSVNRLVRTRLLGGVGAGGEKPPATRLASALYPEPKFFGSPMQSNILKPMSNFVPLFTAIHL